jgi:hypothetical protein
MGACHRLFSDTVYFHRLFPISTIVSPAFQRAHNSRR